MKKFKKALSVMLTASTILGITACGSGSSNSDTSSTTNNAAKTTSTTATTSSQQTTTTSSDDIPTLTWYIPGFPTNMTSDGYQAVSDELNRYAEEKIGCHVELKFFAFSEYAQKCSTIISSGEPFDLMFTCDWLNNFVTNAGSNAYYPLDDILAENAPDAMKEIPDYMWKATTVNGHIYAMPALQVYAKNDGVFLRKDIADEFGVTGSSYDNGVDTYTMDDISDLYAKIKEKYPDIITDDSADVLWTHMDEASGFNFLSGFDVPGVVRFSDETKVINQFETDEFKKYCEMIYDWEQKGYVQPDYASYVTMSDQIAIDRKSDNHITYRTGFTSPTTAADAKYNCGWTEDPVPLITSNKYAVTSGVTQSLTAVGINSKYPEKAVQLYNLAFSDPYFINTMIYGIEGTNYNKVSDTEVELIDDSNYNMPAATFTIANQFNTWVEQGVYPADQWEQAKDFCSDATESKLFGFMFDSSPVKSEVANCSAIYQEYQYPLLCGAVDPDSTIEQLNERLDQAGAQKIIDEMQKQVDAFLEAN